VGTQIFFDSPQIVHPEILGLIPQAQIRKSQIRKFRWCPSVQIANPQIYKAKSSVFDPDPHWFASNIFFYLNERSIF
jgi:hypothetical protein